LHAVTLALCNGDDLVGVRQIPALQYCRRYKCFLELDTVTVAQLTQPSAKCYSNTSVPAVLSCAACCTVVKLASCRAFATFSDAHCSCVVRCFLEAYILQAQKHSSRARSATTRGQFTICFQVYGIEHQYGMIQGELTVS